jgi:NTP pyrophosphatase (non-canonical NTP hydrolase)
MNNKDYKENALRTESNDFDVIGPRLNHTKSIRLLHAGMGMSTEAAEFIDQLKKHIFYGKPLDEVNLAEEIGDLLWYIAIASDELEIDISQIMQTNIDKLRARFPEKFTEEKAENRDLEKERDILEEGSKNVQ